MNKRKFVGCLTVCLVGLLTSVSPATLVAESEVIQESTSTVETVNSEALNKMTSSSTESLPKIIGVEDRTLKWNQSFDSKEGVMATDSKDGVLTDKVKITGKVNTSKAGKYSLTYSVENSQGKKSEKVAVITVQAKEEVNYQLTITEFSVVKNTKLDEEIQKRLVIKNDKNQVVNTKGIKVAVSGSQLADKLGASTVNFSVTLPDGKVLTDKVTITIVSGIRIVESKDGYTYTGSIYEDAIDFMKFIEAYEIDSQGNEKRLGAYDADTKTGIKVIKSGLDISVAGKYAIVYQVINSLGEAVDHTSYVTVVKEKKEAVAPTIQVDDQVLYVGDVLTKEIVLGWAKTTDADKLIFEVIDDQIPTTQLTNRLVKAGVYKIRYTASRVDEDTQAELTAKKEINLTVKEKETTTDTQKNIPTSNGTTAKKSVPTTANKAATLPKTGSEKANNQLIILGGILVIVVLFFILRKEKLAD